MRVKWNRQLDGSLTRRPADEAAPAIAKDKEKDCKQQQQQKGSPKFFRLFRRKKQRRPDDAQPPDDPSLYTPAPSEADEDDCASVSSVASQPITEVCHRDRTLSLFSSFRIGFPGGKKKKRTPLPTAETDDLLQTDKNRYSSPDLRKDGPSVCVTGPGDFVSLGELRAENSQSFHQLRQDRGPKLAKSVSFSDCQPASLTLNETVEEKPKASSRRKRLALASDSAPRSTGEGGSNHERVAPPASVQVPREMNSSRVRNGEAAVPFIVPNDRPGKWVKCDTPVVQIPTDSVSATDDRVRNGDVKSPFAASTDRPGNWVKCLPNTQGANCGVYSKQHSTDRKCTSPNERSEPMPKITPVNPSVKPSSNAKISGTDTYVQSVNLPGTGVSISNFVEELAVRNAPTDNLFPVSVPDRSAFDTSNLNGSPSSESANARLESKTGNTHKVKLETHPESSDTDISAANCVPEFAVRSDPKDTMLSVCEVNYPIHFVTEYSVNCDPKDNVCKANYSENDVHSDTSTCDANLNSQDVKVVDNHSHTESLIEKGNIPPIKFPIDDAAVLNSKCDLSDPNNERCINIHQSDHVARDSYNNLNIVPQVNEPENRVSLTSPICSVNDNDDVLGKMDNGFDCNDTPCTAKPSKEKALADILDFFSSEYKTVSEKSIELFQKAIASNCECLPSLDDVAYCSDFIKGDQLLSNNINHHTIPTCLTQQNDFDCRKRSILHSNYPLMGADSPNNNADSYLQKLVVEEERSYLPYLTCDRRLRVWSVQTTCDSEGPDLGRPPSRGKQPQDRCPDASDMLPSGSSTLVTLHGLDLHIDTPQYASDDGNRRQNAEDPGTTPAANTAYSVGRPTFIGQLRSGFPDEGVVSPGDSGYGRDLCDDSTAPAMLSGMSSVGVYDGSLYNRETAYVGDGEIRMNDEYPRQIYDACPYDDEGCSSGVVSPEISGDSCCMSDESSFVQGDKHLDSETCASESSSPVYLDCAVLTNGGDYRGNIEYTDESSDKHSDTETCVSESSSPVHLDSAGLTNGVKHPHESHSDSQTCGSVELNAPESSPLPESDIEISNGDTPVINGYLEHSPVQHSHTDTCESVKLSVSEPSPLQLGCASVATNGGDCCPLTNGYVESPADSHSCCDGFSGSEPSSMVQEKSAEAASADGRCPVINGYLGDSSGDESYVESLLLTGELTEELISTTLRTDTGLSGTLDEEEVSGTFSVTSDHNAASQDLHVRDVVQDSVPLKMPDILASEGSVCANAIESKISYEGVKKKIEMFESNSPDVSIVTCAPDVIVIAPEEKLPQTRRKSADKGKNSMIPSLKKRHSNAPQEKQLDSEKTKKSVLEAKRVENKFLCKQTKRSNTKYQEGRETKESEKPDTEIPAPQSKTSFDCCIVREVKSDYKCSSSSIELVSDSNLLKTHQISEPGRISADSDSNSTQNVIENPISSDENFNASGTEHVSDSSLCPSTQQLNESFTHRNESNLNPSQIETRTVELDNVHTNDIDNVVSYSNCDLTVQKTSGKGISNKKTITRSESYTILPQNEINSADYTCVNDISINGVEVTDSNGDPTTQQISESIPQILTRSESYTIFPENDNVQPDYTFVNDISSNGVEDPYCNSALVTQQISDESSTSQILTRSESYTILPQDINVQEDYNNDIRTNGVIPDSNSDLKDQEINEDFILTRSESYTILPQNDKFQADYACINDIDNSSVAPDANSDSTVQQISENGTTQILTRSESYTILPQNETTQTDNTCDNNIVSNSNVQTTTQQTNKESISGRCKSEEVLTESGSNPIPTTLKPVRDLESFHFSSSLEHFDDHRGSTEVRTSNLTLPGPPSPTTGGQGQCGLQSRCASLPLVVGQVQSKERLCFARRNHTIKNKDVATTGGRSRIPRKQAGSRGAAAHPATKPPVRPPMWLSKAELTQEIQRLGNLCEARTKELNRLKMETKHVSVGFDAFAALFKYMVEDLNALSVPMLSADLQKTLKQLELAKQDLAYYEREVEEMKAHHCQELNDLSNKLFEVFQGEVTELSAKHQEEMNHLNHDHQKQIESLTTSLNTSSAEVIAQHEELVAKLQQELINQREELQLFQEREIMDMEEKHTQSTKTLQEHIEQLQKKCAELKQHSMGMEDAMRKDTDFKLQWVTARKVDLEKEVESLKAVLEMKNKELHTIRVQNLEMEKQLEDLPLAREKIKMLQARAEDLEALMLEKTKLERKLCTENHEIKETYEKESKVNRRLSMENEELQWRLRQAEQSLITGSFSEVLEYPEEVENGTVSPAKSPSKSPGPHVMSRSVFFTFVDKEDHSSPKSQYKKITPGFSAGYKTSPAKSSKSPPAPSPRRGKSHSEPPQPPVLSSTPRRAAKQQQQQSSSKTSKGTTPKRQRSGSEQILGEQQQHTAEFLSVTGSMASSVSSESSVFDQHKDHRYLEEHREQIMHSLEILREQRSNAEEHQTPEDMSRSAEFSDPKTYYHMTFPVLLKDAAMDDGKVTTVDDAQQNPPTHSKSNGSGGVVEQQGADVDAGDASCEEQTEQSMWRTV